MNLYFNVLGQKYRYYKLTTEQTVKFALETLICLRGGVLQNVESKLEKIETDTFA